eukprot:CAMPEP_0206234866 /NCGR_PEP_ID=MMETSP0047_2-20121206/12826_1 /ASSEMBLY_ACC=CAM_ASM_000192 /TAXON_ID=195065 /ORGANISM="Chroomonas mesostigmatica_cf, Strain CCMP1168" /LENGTH=192 /DNA_ID=CAMNT_0053658995 /DNA_START=35 /DNA_END=609 /DNA_ORIENTATION=-
MAAKEGSTVADKKEAPSKKEDACEGPQSCIICMEESSGDESCSLSCGCKATYCQTCLLKWLGDLDNRSCPTCRSQKVHVLDVLGSEVYQQKLDSGYKDLARSQESGFEDKMALKSASSNFFSAVHCNPGKPQAWVAIGYLLLLLGDNQHAARYIKQAKSVDPTNEDAGKLLDFVLEENKKNGIPEEDEEDAG